MSSSTSSSWCLLPLNLLDNSCITPRETWLTTFSRVKSFQFVDSSRSSVRLSARAVDTMVHNSRADVEVSASFTVSAAPSGFQLCSQVLRTFSLARRLSEACGRKSAKLLQTKSLRAGRRGSTNEEGYWVDKTLPTLWHWLASWFYWDDVTTYCTLLWV